MFILILGIVLAIAGIVIYTLATLRFKGEGEPLFFRVTIQFTVICIILGSITCFCDFFYKRGAIDNASGKIRYERIERTSDEWIQIP